MVYRGWVLIEQHYEAVMQDWLSVGIPSVGIIFRELSKKFLFANTWVGKVSIDRGWYRIDRSRSRVEK